ncbi:MAG: hypothetical protein R3B84_16320 [Zavarzinella sp.]
MIFNSCPECKQKNQHRYSSVNTVQACKHCGEKYIVSKPRISSAEISEPTINPVKVLGGLVILCLGCCGIAGFALLTKDEKSDPEIQTVVENQVTSSTTPRVNQNNTNFALAKPKPTAARTGMSSATPSSTPTRVKPKTPIELAEDAIVLGGGKVDRRGENVIVHLTAGLWPEVNSSLETIAPNCLYLPKISKRSDIPNLPKSLTSVSIGLNRLDVKMFDDVLLALEEIPNLTSLRIYSGSPASFLPPNFFAKVAKLKNIKNLDIADLGAASDVHLIELASVTTLELLCLSSFNEGATNLDEHLTSNGLKMLAKLPLQAISIRNAEPQHQSGLKPLPELKLVHFYTSASISEVAITDFQKTHPGAIIDIQRTSKLPKSVWEEKSLEHAKQ